MGGIYGRASVAVFAMVLVAATGLAGAQETPDAAKVLQEAMDFAKGHAALDLGAKAELAMSDGEDEGGFELDINLALRGEKDLHLVMSIGDDEVQVISNGEDSFFYFVSEAIYQPAPKTATRANLVFSVVPRDLRQALALTSLYLHGKKDVTSILSDLEYVGKEELTIGDATIACHHLRGKSDSDTVDWWFEASDTPWARRLVMDMSGSIRQMTGVSPQATLKATLDCERYDTAPKFEDARFAFVPPEGVSLPPEPGSDPMLGKPAPDIKLPLLGGGTMDLATHRGKDVVVVEFFATWCGPCRQAMPTVIDVTSKYPDGNVAFYAVNLRETEEQVNTLLETFEVKPTVAMDKDGEAANAYKVQSIPRTIIIDRNGKVSAGHEGAGPNLRQELRLDIEKAFKVPVDGAA